MRTPLVDRLATAPRDAAQLTAWLTAVPIAPDEVTALFAPDPHHPYGRRVLVAGDGIEVMLATWTRGASCAPHDHGGATGAVRVLSGACIHTCFAAEGAALRPVLTERKAAGDVLTASPDLVHAMQDVGDAPLVTLHVYAPAIAEMVVYDLAGARTLVVAGRCGAWIPEDPADIVRSAPGFRPPASV